MSISQRNTSWFLLQRVNIHIYLLNIKYKYIIYFQNFHYSVLRFTLANFFPVAIATGLVVVALQMKANRENAVKHREEMSKLDNEIINLLEKEMIEIETVFTSSYN